MPKLILIDGSGYIYRAFYAVTQPLTNSEGLPTNGLYGFTKMLTKLLNKELTRDSKTHIAIAFDTAEPTFRHERFEAYKANRSEAPEDLVPQFPYFREIAKFMGFSILEQAGVEADDLIGTLAKKFEFAEQDGEPFEIKIISGDKDLSQLVSDKISVYDAMRDITYDRDRVIEKFGIPPEKIVDYLAIVGDTSDNVPGIKGVGPKGACALLNHFGSIDDIISRVDEISTIKGLRGAANIQSTISGSINELLLSRELVTLKLDCEPLLSECTIEHLEFTGPEPQNLRELFEFLDFKNLYDEFIKKFSHTVEKERALVEVITRDNFPVLVEALRDQQELSIDLETDSLEVRSTKIIGIGFSIKSGQEYSQYYVPFLSELPQYQNHLTLNEFIENFGHILSNQKILKIGSNLKFDYQVLKSNGIELKGIGFDTMIASYCLSPDMRDHGLKSLALRYLSAEMTTYDDLTLNGSVPLSEIPVQEVANYCGEDVLRSFELKEFLEDKLKTIGGFDLIELFTNIEMPLVPVLGDMELAGIKVDTEYLNNLADHFASELALLEDQIKKLAGRDFNVNSPKQLSEILFNDLSLPTKGIKKTTHGFSTDSDSLLKLKDHHDIANNLLEYREIFKLKSTYVDALLRLADEETHRIHANFNQSVTATGRLSSSNPNLQNIPIRNQRGRLLRNAFVADEGCDLVIADYSQIELRLLAHLSKDPTLIDSFLNDEDIHLRTAKELFGEIALAGAESKELRRAAKTINFGIVYGMGAIRLADELAISRKEAESYISGYFGRYPGVKNYFELTEQKIKTDGYIETLCGRRRYLGELDTSGRDPGYAVRSLLNAPLQGSAAEIIKIAMNNVARVISDKYSGVAKLVLQIHDELIIEVRSDSAKILEQELRHIMSSAIELLVPLKVESRISKSWGDR